MTTSGIERNLNAIRKGGLDRTKRTKMGLVLATERMPSFRARSFTQNSQHIVLPTNRKTQPRRRTTGEAWQGSSSSASNTSSSKTTTTPATMMLMPLSWQSVSAGLTCSLRQGQVVYSHTTVPYCRACGPNLRRTHNIQRISTLPSPAPLHAATALLARLDLTERKLRVLLASSIAPSSDRDTSVSPDPLAVCVCSYNGGHLPHCSPSRAYSRL